MGKKGSENNIIQQSIKKKYTKQWSARRQPGRIRIWSAGLSGVLMLKSGHVAKEVEATITVSYIRLYVRV